MPKILFGFILLVFLIIISACQPSGQSVNSQKSVNLVSSWSGSYQPQGSPDPGTISFKLYDDNSMNLTANISKNNYSLSASGSYTLNGTNFSFSGTGTASKSFRHLCFKIDLIQQCIKLEQWEWELFHQLYNGKLAFGIRELESSIKLRNH